MEGNISVAPHRIMKPIFLLLLLQLGFGKLYDGNCPSKRLSIGACLVGLCPAGSECIGSVCCKTKKSDSTTKGGEEEIEEEGSPEFGACVSGYHAIGECISDTCPDGYICEDLKCCSKLTRDRKNRKENQTAIVPEDSEENEIEQLKKEYQKLKELLEKKMKSKWISPTKADFTTTTTTTTLSTTTIEEKSESEEETTGGEESEKETTEKSEEVDETTDEMTTTQRKSTEKFPSSTTKFSSLAASTRRSSPTIQQTSTPTITTTLSSTSTSTSTEAESTTEEEIQHCPVGGPIGECISNQCPEGHTCFNNFCCILTPELNCTDALAHCKAELCDRRGYKDFMTRQCAKTCARCHFILGEKVECRDRRTDCAEWAAEGFCQSTLYTTRQKMKFCGKSCKLC